MIKGFKHRGLKKFKETGSKAKIKPAHARRLSLILALLDAATELRDMVAPRLGLHPLHREREGHWAVEVNGPWRVTFRFEGEDVVDVDYTQHH